MYTLESKRLGLRQLETSDVDNLFEVLSDPETMQFYPRPYSKEETGGWISKSIQSYVDNRFGLWAMILKTDDQFIGQCGITMQNIDQKVVPEIGYHVNKKFWNQGFATEASRLCLRYGFFELNLEEIFIHTSLRNTPSQRIAEKVGMIKRKEYDKQVSQEGLIDRHIVYSLKKNQYQP
jgi:RimJ/RimL family protein N-acetyltransferase